MSTQRAIIIFWQTLTLCTTVALGYDMFVLGDVGGREWGGAGVQLVIAIVVYAIAALPAAGFHAAAIYLLRRMYPSITASLRAASSVLSAVAVLVAGITLFLLAPKEADWPILVVIGPFSFVLTLLVVPLVGQLRKSDEAPPP